MIRVGAAHVQNGSDFSFPALLKSDVAGFIHQRERRHWCSGNIGASQALAPGSIPGWRTILVNHYPNDGMLLRKVKAYLLGLLAKIKCSICS